MQTTLEGVEIVAEPRAVGQLLQMRDVPASQHHVIDLQNFLQPRDDFGHGLAPFFLAEPFAAALTDVVLESTAALVGHVTDLHGLDDAVENQRCPETRAAAEK